MSGSGSAHVGSESFLRCFCHPEESWLDGHSATQQQPIDPLANLRVANAADSSVGEQNNAVVGLDGRDFKAFRPRTPRPLIGQLPVRTCSDGDAGGGY